MAGSPGYGFALAAGGESSPTLSRQELDVVKVRRTAPGLQGSPAGSGALRSALAEGSLFLSSGSFSGTFIQFRVFQGPSNADEFLTQDIGDEEEGGKSMGESEPGGTEDRRPTPVRQVMETGEPEEESVRAGIRELTDPGTGEQWVARVSGRSTSGVLPLRIIPLMEVGFARADRPDLPLRRALTQGDSLEELDDQELLELFSSAGPFNSPSTEPSRQARGDRRDKKRRRT